MLCQINLENKPIITKEEPKYLRKLSQNCSKSVLQLPSLIGYIFHNTIVFLDVRKTPFFLHCTFLTYQSSTLKCPFACIKNHQFKRLQQITSIVLGPIISLSIYLSTGGKTFYYIEQIVEETVDTVDTLIKIGVEIEHQCDKIG